MSNNILLILVLILVLNAFFIGYFLGKQQSSQTIEQPSLCSIKKNKQVCGTKSQISIDDTKFVVDINTNNLEKKYEKLGESTQSSENISDSVNKLKSMKG